MKKSLLALAALTAFAGAASAQSSVTLFGIIDLAATEVKNGSSGKIKSLAQDGINSSRLGFRGVEDLGGGLRAGFWLEGALGADTGCGGSGTLGTPATCSGQTWQRRSTVSLLGAFGEVRLGRDYVPTFWNLTIFDPFGTNGVGSALNNLSTLGSGVGTAVRANNTIAYFLPAMGGLYGQLTVAAGERTQTGFNKYVGGRIGYGAGPFNAAVAYGQTEKDGTMIDDFTNWNVGGSYNFGFLTVMGYYGEYDYGNLKQKQALAGVTVPIGAGTIKASYIKTGGDGNGISSDQYAVGYQYDLSKRTALYAQYASLNNDGSAATGAKFQIYGANGSNAFPAVNGGGQTSSGYQFGVRHSF